ncbi:MAG: acetate/propionate family kinase [Pseudomonadota bacterium]
MTECLLTLNAGSSSIKFAVYEPDQEPRELARGQVENLGAAARLVLSASDGVKEEHELGKTDHSAALQAILSRARERFGDWTVCGVGHRIAHGGTDFVEPRELDTDTLDKLRALEPLAPLHQPHNLAAVAAAQQVFPNALQVGCFDTAFHRDHPWVNDTFALPRRYFDQGVRRYGFHGLSYDYVTGALRSIAPSVAEGRVVIAHLGNGASMCAIQGGKSIASTMGFSALDGLPMGTRCGQLDPGVMLYLLDSEKLSSAEIATLLYQESGLKGLSGLTHDMRSLEASDLPEARQAIDYFVFRIRREIGASCAVLGGLDALVFCGGIGENSPYVRARTCENMDWIGLSIDAQRNAKNALNVSAGPVPILVVPTDEERVIARAIVQLLGHAPQLA